MRNLEECKAEIFRRSKIRIRRRRRILAACIPCVFCVVLSAVLLWPSEGKSTDLPVVDGLTLETAVSMEYSLAEVRVAGSGISLCHAEPETAGKILDLIENSAKYQTYSSAQDEPEVTPETYGEAFDHTNTDRHWIIGGTGTDINNAGPTMAPPETELPAYTLTFVYRDGSTQIYTLTGYQLKNAATDQTRYLSPEDADTLLQLLQLPAVMKKGETP